MASTVAQVGGYLRSLRRTREMTTAPETHLTQAGAGSLALRSASLGLGFICHLLLTRLLGARGYGSYAYALACVTALSVPATLGLERLLVREVAAYRARSEWAAWRGLLVWSGRLLLAVACAIALGAVLVSRLVAGGGEGLPVFWLAMLSLPLLSLLRLKQSVMQGMHRTLAGQAPEALVQPFLLAALLAAGLACGMPLTATWAMALNVAAAGLALVCCAVMLERSLPRAVKEAAPSASRRLWMKSVLPLLIVSGANALSGQIPVLMLGAMRDAEAAGILAVAKRLADLTTFPSLALNVVLTPALASMWAMRDAPGLQRAVTVCARWVTLLSLPPALVFILFGRTLLRIFGQPFVAGWTAMSLLCVAQMVNVAAGSVGLLLLMTGRESKVAFVSVACAALNLLLSALLIPRWGMNGAATGAGLSMIVWNLWLAWSVWRLLGIRPTIFARKFVGADEAS